MMQMSRAPHLLQTQDENASSTILRQEKGGAALGTAGGKNAAGGASHKPLTDRRALGNITNKASAGLGQPSIAKGKPADSVARRALGDITNSVPAKQQGAGAGKGEALKPVAYRAPMAPLEARPASQQVAAVQQQSAAEQRAAAADAALQLKAELYARDGIEKIAGERTVLQHAYSDR